MGTYVNIQNGLVDRLRKETIELPQTVDYERVHVLNDIYKEYAGMPASVIRARFFERLLATKTLYVDDNLFVGSLAGKPGAFYFYPEWNVDCIKDATFEIPAEEQEAVDQCIAFWEKRCLKYRTAKRWEEKTGTVCNFLNGSAGCSTQDFPAGGGNVNYEKAITRGLRSLIDEAKERAKRIEPLSANKEQYNFYEGVQIALEAIITYSNRYADLAEQMAADESDSAKKQELLTKAQICRRVPEYPATTLREAMQCEWMMHICAEIEQVGCAHAQGYLGQIFEPFYLKDREAGMVDEEEAIYMLEHLFLKQNDINYYYGQEFQDSNSADLGETINVGGYTPDGQDATAEMDYLILEADKRLHMPHPQIALFYHSRMQPGLMKKAMESVASGNGKPQFMNADVAVMRSLNAYSKYGATLEDCRRTGVFGCVATGLVNQSSFLGEGSINLAKPLELVFYNGYDPLFDEQVGIKTGDPESFETFEDFYQAFKAQLDYLNYVIRDYNRLGNIVQSEFLPLPIRSALLDGCLESGKDVWSGGTKYSMTSYTSACATDAINGLAAVKALVYDEKKVSMKELIAALKADFEGYEEIQKLCLNAPKHGNGDKGVRAIAQRFFKDELASYKKAGNDFLGHDARPDTFSKSVHNQYGMFTGALPTGRKKGVALTDGSLSAQVGTDKKGVSVLVGDAALAQDAPAFDAAHLNVRIVKDQFDTPEGADAVINLVKSFMDLGGNHIQFNCVSTEELKDAQIHPENHEDLLVRVAGFSAFFVRLHEGVQNEIIDRTEHSA